MSLVSKDDVKKWAKEVSMDIAPYVEETLKALTRYLLVVDDSM